MKKNNLTKISYPLIIIIYFLVTQVPSLIYEVINWDLGTLLSVSRELDRGNLIYEYQAEGKGPILFYIYNFLIKISNYNIVLIKFFHDLFVLSAALLLYVNSLKIFNSFTNSLFVSLGFLSFMSVFPYGHSENWEIFCINFVLIAILIKEYSRSYDVNLKIVSYFFVGIFLSLSSLVNISSFIFFTPFLFELIILKTKNREKLRYFFASVFGIFLPWLYFIILYTSNNLLERFIRYNFTLLYDYSEYNPEFLNITIENLKLYLIETVILFENHQIYVHFFTILLILFIFCKFAIKLPKLESTFYSILVLSSGLIYFIAQRGYFHHLFFIICFSSLYFGFIKFPLERNMLIVIFVINFVIFSNYNFYKINDILKNFTSLETNYPLYQFVKEDALIPAGDFTVLGLDHPLIMFYLDKPNVKYYAHVTLKDHVNDDRNQTLEGLLESQPDVIICSKTLVETCKLENKYSYYFSTSPQNNTFFYNYDIHYFIKNK